MAANWERSHVSLSLRSIHSLTLRSVLIRDLTSAIGAKRRIPWLVLQGAHAITPKTVMQEQQPLYKS